MNDNQCKGCWSTNCSIFNALCINHQQEIKTCPCSNCLVKVACSKICDYFHTWVKSFPDHSDYLGIQLRPSIVVRRK